MPVLPLVFFAALIHPFPFLFPPRSLFFYAISSRLLEQGGDWDKRNRLRAYEGVYRIMRRDFNGAAELLVNVLATFTSFELMDMRTFVMYACVASSIAFSRVPLKDQVSELGFVF